MWSFVFISLIVHEKKKAQIPCKEEQEQLKTAAKIQLALLYQSCKSVARKRGSDP